MTTYDTKEFVGVVEWVDPTYKTDDIRASIPGIYQTNSLEDIKYLPRIKAKQIFQKRVQRGDKVRVYIAVNPNRDYGEESLYDQERLIKTIAYYEPIAERSDNALQYLADNAKSKPEIMVFHENAGNTAAVLYDDGNGFTTHTGGGNGEGTMMQVAPNGNFGFKSSTMQITGENGVIKFGDSSEEATQHPSVLGDKLKELLKDSIYQCFMKAAQELSAIQRENVAAVFEECAADLSQKLEDLTTDQVQISKSI